MSYKRPDKTNISSCGRCSAGCDDAVDVDGIGSSRSDSLDGDGDNEVYDDDLRGGM